MTAEEVIAVYGDTVYRAAYASLRHRADAEDVTQETLLRYLCANTVFESDEHIRAWLLHVALNLCRNRRRFAFLHATAPLEEAGEVETEETAHPELRAALASLPQQAREVIYLYYYAGYRTAEIAHILGCRESTARSKLYRARANLRELLKGVYTIEET